MTRDGNRYKPGDRVLWRPFYATHGALAGTIRCVSKSIEYDYDIDFDGDPHPEFPTAVYASELRPEPVENHHGDA